MTSYPTLTTLARSMYLAENPEGRFEAEDHSVINYWLRRAVDRDRTMCDIGTTAMKPTNARENAMKITDLTPEAIALLMKRQAKEEPGLYSWFNDGKTGIITKCISRGDGFTWVSIGDDDAVRKTSESAAIKNIAAELREHVPHSLGKYLTDDPR